MSDTRRKPRREPAERPFPYVPNAVPVTRNRIRDQRVTYLNGRRWQTAVLARGRHARATFVGPDATPAAFLTATAGMYGPVSATHRAFGFPQSA